MCTTTNSATAYRQRVTFRAGCVATAAPATGISARIPSGIGVNRDGAFAEYIVVPAANLWLIPREIPSEIAAFFDPYGNAVHCALSFQVVGEDVLITGAGPIGIMAAGICRYLGARHVVITDINEYRLKLAEKMGATHLVNVARESLDEAMQAQDIKAGFDIGLEMSGNPQAFNDMLRHMYNGGRIALLGILPAGTPLTGTWSSSKASTLRGSMAARCSRPGTR